MAEDTSIFDSGNSTQDNATTSSSEVVASTSQDTSIKISDTKTYKNIDEFKKAYTHAEEHIKRIEKENAELRAKAERSATINEILEQVKSGNALPTEPVPGNTTVDVTHLRSAIKQEIKEDLELEKLQKIQQDNADQVANALRSQLGDKAKETYFAKAAELGMDVSALDRLAREQPKAVMSLFNVTTKSESTSQYGSGSMKTTTVTNSNQAKKSELIKQYWKNPFNATSVWKEIEKLEK